MRSIELDAAEILATTQAMATEITLRLAPEGADPGGADRAGVVERALDVFATVEASCTRFDPTSPLMGVNAEPDEWHRVPEKCFEALLEAWRAYELTGGRFDPRVFTDLVALGYDRSLPFATEDVAVDGAAPRRRLSRLPWRPRFRPAGREVRLGGLPVDLGGIAKGLAVRWASAALAPVTPNHVVNAGGDCYCAGTAPDGSPWRVGIEDPAGRDDPVVVVALCDHASATSSTRVRRWTAHGVPVHHLIDPRSGLPGGLGLAAVTVVAPDPATAEVWSKVLFLAGAAGVAAEAARRSLAACWVTPEGAVGMSAAMEQFVVWRRR